MQKYRATIRTLEIELVDIISQTPRFVRIIGPKGNQIRVPKRGRRMGYFSTHAQAKRWLIDMVRGREKYTGKAFPLAEAERAYQADEITKAQAIPDV